jgi:hypothetical protein
MGNLTIASGIPHGVLVFSSFTGVHFLFQLGCFLACLVHTGVRESKCDMVMENLTIASGVPHGVLVISGPTGKQFLAQLGCFLACLLPTGGQESKCDVVPHHVQGRSQEWIGGLNRAKPRMALSTNTTVFRLDGDVPP